MAGIDGQALDFDTLSDGVSVAHHADLNVGTGPFTLACWIRNSNTPGSIWKRIITKRGAGLAWYSLCLSGNHLILELAENYPTGYVILATPTVIQGDGLWHHVAAVRDKVGNVTFYIDGVEYPVGVSTLNLDNSDDLFIADGEDYGGESYKGKMDDVRIGGLVGTNTQSTIANSCATGMVLGNSNLGGLVGYYSSGNIINCYWDKDTTGELSSPGGGTGKTTEQMKQHATFVDWDFLNIGEIGEHQTYPYFRVDSIPGDINGDGIVNLPDWAILAGHWLEDGREG